MADEKLILFLRRIKKRFTRNGISPPILPMQALKNSLFRYAVLQALKGTTNPSM